jgi:pimeloyl-ACP methyl ester carboxylesterase
MIALILVGKYFSLCRAYLGPLVRIFQEKPLFIIPHGQPVPGAEEVSIKTADGLTLRGCYFRGSGPRRGVILFGLEFGSNRWACVPYCDFLLVQGFDIFTFEPRGQGESDRQPGYEPLQWVTEHEVRDTEAAVAYLKARADADPAGIGFFGISKGAAAGLAVAARDPYLRCFVTDGVFATYTTLVPYMRQWFRIYNSQYVLQGLLPSWYYGWVGLAGLRQTERERHCRFVHLEHCVHRLAPRPILMIHGGADTYIKPQMAQALFDRMRPPKEFWLVEGARHNQSLQLAGDAYRRRVLEFFLKHLEESPPGDERTKSESEDSRTECPVSSLAPPLRASSNIPSQQV